MFRLYVYFGNGIINVEVSNDMKSWKITYFYLNIGCIVISLFDRNNALTKWPYTFFFGTNYSEDWFKAW